MPRSNFFFSRPRLLQRQLARNRRECIQLRS